MDAKKIRPGQKDDVVFGIDVDEVLRCLLCEMVSLYNNDVIYPDSISVDDVKDFVVETSFPEIQKRTGMRPSEWFFRKHGHRLFRYSKAIEGAVDAVNKLKLFGKVIIISYQKSTENKIDTIEWLDAHGIEYDGICFVKDKSVVHTDYLIDDNDWNFIGCNAEKGVLITAPYNKEKPLDDILAKSNCSEIRRFNSIAEFADWYESQFVEKEEHCFTENYL